MAENTFRRYAYGGGVLYLSICIVTEFIVGLYLINLQLFQLEKLH